MSKTIDITVPYLDFMGAERTERVTARVINARWCAHNPPSCGWNLTHRLTGFAAAKGLESFAKATALARDLDRAYSPKRWAFTDPDEAKGMKKAKAIVKRYEAVS